MLFLVCIIHHCDTVEAIAFGNAQSLGHMTGRNVVNIDRRLFVFRIGADFNGAGSGAGAVLGDAAQPVVSEAALRKAGDPH